MKVRRLVTAVASLMAVACVDHVVGPSPDVPIASAYPRVASRFVVNAAAATDSRVPVITASTDSVFVGMVVPSICGRDTVMAGAARDTVVVTLRRTMLPLPCALTSGVRIGVVAASASSHQVIVSVQTQGFQDTTRALVATAIIGVPHTSERNETLTSGRLR